MPTNNWYQRIPIIAFGVWFTGAVLTGLLFTLTDREPNGKLNFSRDLGAKLSVALSWFATCWGWNWPQLRKDLRS